MYTDSLFSQSLAHIHWLWFAVAVILSFGVGTVWYSVLFSKEWLRVFKVEIPERVTAGSFIRTMGIQFAVNALFGFTFFILAGLSPQLAALTLVAVCAWQKGQMNFQFSKWKDFATAAIIHAGYTFVSGIIFILFALI